MTFNYWIGTLNNPTLHLNDMDAEDFVSNFVACGLASYAVG